MRIALAQFNPIVGDISGNTAKIIHLAQQAKAQGAQVMLTPELALTGYPPEDLLLRNDFHQAVNNALETLLSEDDITLIIGHPLKQGNECFNTASVIRDGNYLGQYHKMTLPNEEVFDECRYFTPGIAPLVFEQAGSRFGILICEDVWATEPAAATTECGANVIFVLNASPFHRQKFHERQQAVRYRALENQVPIIYVNMVGGQDELVFDGASFAVNQNGDILSQAAFFKEELIFLDMANNHIMAAEYQSIPGELEMIYEALVTSVRDYVNKNSFSGVLLGLSGGIDSALTLTIAVDALGADKVSTVMMPSSYTAQISVEDSRKMIKTLGITYQEIDIWPIYETFIQSLSSSFADKETDSTEENIQARIRGTLLMALSNKTGNLVLTTGNKSELATGYCTLYGDMVGGFAPLKDVEKTLVYQLSLWRNSKQEIIPLRIIQRPPSAELSPGQTDQDSLPKYDILDAILTRYVEHNQSADQIISSGYLKEDVQKVIRLITSNEYKRKQGPIGPKITHRAFGKDWRYPITNRYR